METKSARKNQNVGYHKGRVDETRRPTARAVDFSVAADSALVGEFIVVVRQITHKSVR